MENLLISLLENKKKKGPFYELNTILVKIRLQDLSGKIYVTDQDISFVSEYLFSVEYWGCYELLLL